MKFDRTGRKLMCYECEGPYTIDSTKYDRFPTLPCHLSQGVRRYCDKYGCLFTVNPTTGTVQLHIEPTAIMINQDGFINYPSLNS
jgi:hypothetical protein